MCNIFTCRCGSHYIPQRYFTDFMVFLGLVIAYSNRNCLNMAITEMVIPTIHNDTNIDGEVCPYPPDEEPMTKGGDLNWTEAHQGYVLGAFFAGYVITHVPGGVLADNLGGKQVLGIGILLTSLGNIVTPISTSDGDWKPLVVIRILMGFAQGPLFPSIATLMSKWIPRNERSTIGALVITGAQIGTITGNYVTSVLIYTSGHWQFPYYFWGITGFAWYTIFCILCYSEPSQHPFMRPEESAMLEEKIGKSEKKPIPWLAIFTDKAVWALIIGHIGHDWIFFLILVQLPKYMKDVLKFNIKQNGVLTAIPYLGLWLCSTVSGIVADKIIKSGKMSVLNVRRLLTIIGHLLPMLCVMAASYMGCNRGAAAAMFVLSMFTMGPFYPGMRINALDITKNFAGIIMAVSNGLGALGYIPIPAMTAALTPNHTIEQWRLVFYMLAIGLGVTTALYVIWASGEQAKWDKASTAK